VKNEKSIKHNVLLEILEDNAASKIKQMPIDSKEIISGFLKGQVFIYLYLLRNFSFVKMVFAYRT